MTPDLARSIASTHRAEDNISRMAQLKTMSSAQLADIMGGDPASVTPWVEAAAACGMATAQLQLGRMLLDGTGLPEDKVMALAWFTRAARAGNDALDIAGEAQNMAGRCHELGWGTPADPVAAVAWYQRAAASGDSWGLYNLANMLFDGRGIAQDHRAAFDHYRRASQLGHARAMNLLGRCLEEGWGTPRDPVAAAYWYRRSADGDYFRGQYNHGVELLRQGCREDAAAMFQRASAGGDDAMRAQIRELLDIGDNPYAKHIAQ